MLVGKQIIQSCTVIVALLLCMKITAKDIIQKEGECECEDIAPPGDYTCEDQKRFDKCDRTWMLDNNFCSLTCGRCSCSAPTPSPEINSKAQVQQQKQQQQQQQQQLQQIVDAAIQAAGQIQNTSINTIFSGGPEQEKIINSNLSINSVINQETKSMQQSKPARQDSTCTCTDIAPPSAWEFTCQQHMLAGNCNHEALIKGEFCSLSCGRCPCSELGPVDVLGTIINSNFTQQRQFLPIPIPPDIEPTPTPLPPNKLPPNNNNNINTNLSTPTIEEPTNDGIIDLISNQGSFRNDAYGSSRLDPYSPVDLLSSLLTKVQQGQINSSDIIASLNSSQYNIEFNPTNITPISEEIEQSIQSPKNISNISQPVTSSITSVPIVLPRPTVPSPLTGVPTPPLRVPDNTLEFQRLSLPQLAFDLGVADVPLLNLQVVDTEDVKVSQNNQIVVGTDVNSAVFRPKNPPEGGTPQGPSPAGYVPMTGQKIRGEGDLRSPKCFMSALEEIDDLSLFNKVMHDVGIALAHLIIPSDETVTFIAPSNTAIMRLMYKSDIAFQQFLDAPPDLLMALVSYHALKGDFQMEDIEKMGAIDTMLGQLIYVEKGVGKNDEKIYLSGHEQEEATLIETDIEACGIMLHTIDTLLMPAGLNRGFQAVFLMQSPDFSSEVSTVQQGQRKTEKEQCLNQTLEEVLEQQEDTSAALFSLQQSNLLQDFEEGPITMFVPTDKVFLQFINKQLGQRATSLERESNILLHHIVMGERLTSDDLFSVNSLETSYPGGQIDISKDASQIIIQSGDSQAQIIASNLGNSCNIVVHTIDHVLLPQIQTQLQTTLQDTENEEMAQITTSSTNTIQIYDQQQYQQQQQQQQLQLQEQQYSQQKQQNQQQLQKQQQQLNFPAPEQESELELDLQQQYQLQQQQVPLVEDFTLEDDLLSPLLEDEFLSPIFEDFFEGFLDFSNMVNVPFGDALVPLDSPIESGDQVDMEKCMTIGDALSGMSELSVMNLWLMDTGFQELLSQKDSEVTLLAPTNEAFGVLMRDLGVTLDSLRDQPEQWNIFLDSLALHIVDEPLRFQDLINPLEAKTLANNSKDFSEIIEFQPVLPSTVKVSAKGSQSRIIGAAIQACRSYIYPIDSFLLTQVIKPTQHIAQPPPTILPPPPPPSPLLYVQKQDATPPCQTVDQVIMNDPRMVSFQTLLSRAGLLDIVGDASNITIFVPQNDGMSVILRALYDDVIKLNGNALQVWSGYHIVPGIWNQKSLTQGKILGTLAGGENGALSLEVDINPGKGSGNIVNLVGLSNSASIVEGDIEACGAMLHILDGPLLPVERDRVQQGDD